MWYIAPIDFIQFICVQQTDTRGPTKGKKRKRCQKCEPCLRPRCGQCSYCIHRERKQQCILKRCVQLKKTKTLSHNIKVIPLHFI